jgi:NADH-quinone oxidoreductase subunit N
MEEALRSLHLFLPEVALTVALLLVALVDATLARWRVPATHAISALGLLAATVLALQTAPAGEIFSGMVAVDALGAFFKALIAAAALCVLLSFRDARELRGVHLGEFQVLLLAVTLSCMLLATANDLVMMYLALEMVSIGSYVMVAYGKGDRLSNEASLKYVVFGAASSAVMLYGMSLLYGMTGTTKLPAIQLALQTAAPSEGGRFALHLVVLLVLAGFGFKTASVPFHFWCPDVYQGAPIPVTAYLSVAPKAAGFAVMARFFYGGLSAPGLGGRWDLAASAVDWPSVLMVVSVATMTLGNVAALTQTNLKRLLAYSSIAHAGYVLMGVVALSEQGMLGIIVYLLAYLVMNLGAFLVVTIIHRQDGSFDVRDYPGLGKRAPFLTFAMAIFLLSLTGIPPLAGFMGKLYVFGAVIEKGRDFYAFAMIGALNAALGAYYYFRVLRAMVIDTPSEERPAFDLCLRDKFWLGLYVAANLLAVLFWPAVEQWTRGSLVLWAGR